MYTFVCDYKNSFVSYIQLFLTWQKQSFPIVDPMCKANSVAGKNDTEPFGGDRNTYTGEKQNNEYKNNLN